MGRFWAWCNLGSDLSPSSTTTVADLGLLGAAIYGAILIDQAFTAQSPEQGGGCRCLPNLLGSVWFPRRNSCLLSNPVFRNKSLEIVLLLSRSSRTQIIVNPA
jgi:hypothetical protein